MNAFLTSTSPVMLTDNEWVTVCAALITAGNGTLAESIKTQVLGTKEGQ